jgi:hypothetical protein
MAKLPETKPLAAETSHRIQAAYGMAQALKKARWEAF